LTAGTISPISGHNLAALPNRRIRPGQLRFAKYDESLLRGATSCGWTIVYREKWFELLAKVSVNLSSILSKSYLNRVHNNLLLLVTYEIKHDLNRADEQPKWVFYRDSRYLSN